MPKRINPQDRWEDDFLVPLPGEPRNIGPLETLFQRLLNRTERLKNRIGAILGLPWDATPPDTIAGLAGRVRTLETNQGGTTLSAHRTAATLDHPDGSVTLQKLSSSAFSASITPNTLALRNAQGSVQDGATLSHLRVLRVGGMYTWSGVNKWLRLVRWTGLSGNYRGVFADLHIYRTQDGGISGRLRARVTTDASGVLVNPVISVANDNNIIITNAILLQTDNDAIELWAYFPHNTAYVSGVVGSGSGAIELTPYGDVSSLIQDTAPTPAPDGIYLEWAGATANQTPFGPGYIVAAGRGTTSGYIRYDNGVQVVWDSINVGNSTWTFPAAFASPPKVLATAETANATPRVVTLTSVSTTAAGILRTDLSGNVQSGIVHLYAVGLWK